MAAGLVLSYGTFISIIIRYLFPPDARKSWVFVQDLSSFKSGDSLPFRAPNGERIAIARQGMSGGVSDFVALSSTCPHLGCQVHWEAANNRFFCPCHNGAFNAGGKAIAGPPAEAGQSLFTYPLKVEEGLLYIEVPLEKLNDDGSGLLRPRMPSVPHQTSTFLPGSK